MRPKWMPVLNRRGSRILDMVRPKLFNIGRWRKFYWTYLETTTQERVSDTQDLFLAYPYRFTSARRWFLEHSLLIHCIIYCDKEATCCYQTSRAQKICICKTVSETAYYVDIWAWVKCVGCTVITPWAIRWRNLRLERSSLTGTTPEPVTNPGRSCQGLVNTFVRLLLGFLELPLCTVPGAPFK